jgi:uncharacterized RDD family membrane protein YckC
MSTWYYSDAELERQGPLSTDELKQRFRNQTIALETLVWRDGMLHWRPLAELATQLNLLESAEFGHETAPTPRVVPHQSRTPPAMPLPPAPEPDAVEPPTTGRAVFNLGNDPVELPPPSLAELAELRSRALPATDSEQEHNPYRPAHAALRPRIAAAQHAHVVYAGFWKRAAALIVDSVIVGIVGNLGGEALGTILGDLAGGGDKMIVLLVALITFALNIWYFAFFHSAFSLATPGKMIVGIKVVRSHGEPISFLRGVGRVFATIPSTLLLFAGYLMAAFTDRKRALHDMISDTVVVDKWAFSKYPEQQREELGTAAVVILVGYALLLVLAIVAVVALGVAVRNFRG